jgi:hypothetical protein
MNFKNIKEIQVTQCVTLVVECPMCGKHNEITITAQQWEQLNTQSTNLTTHKILHDHNVEERELITTGMCEECVNRLRNLDYPTHDD